MIKKILIGVFLFFLVLLAGLITFSVVFKDEVIQMFVAEANKSIDTPVEVESFDLTLFSDFPRLSVSMNQLVIMESTGDHRKELGRAETVHFRLSLWDLIQGKYTIDKVSVRNGSFSLREMENGEINYRILKSKENAEKNPSDGNKVAFEIDRILLKNVGIEYSRDYLSEYYGITARDLTARWKSDDLQEIDLSGELLLDSVQVRKIVYGKREAKINGVIKLGNDRSVEIQNAELNYLDSDYNVNVSILKENIDVQLTSKNSHIESLMGLIPENYQKPLLPYRSKGDIQVNASLSMKKEAAPELKVEFDGRNVSIFVPEYNKTLSDLDLKGILQMDDLNDPTSYKVGIEEFKGNMEGDPIEGSISVVDFEEYLVDLVMESELDLEDILSFYPVQSLSQPEGRVDLAISVFGKLKSKDKSDLRATGEVNLDNVGFVWEKSPHALSGLTGNFLFNNEDISISDFSGNWGTSDFMINGFLKNVLQKLVDPHTVIGIEADLSSNFIDLDELLAMEAKDRKDTLYRFNIPPEINLNFNCKVDRIKFRRFRSRNNYGSLKVANSRASMEKVSFNIAGGKVDLNAEIDSTHPDSVFVYGETAYDRIDIDSIFYIFENFNQDFLVDSHLKGQVYAKVKSGINLDRYLTVNKNSIQIESSYIIRNGELNNFEPMLQLSKYLNEENLDHLLFSDLENQVVINKSTIQLPETEVRSNVTNISIRGTHTFDQRIDYYLKVPLIRNIKPDKDEAFGAIEDDGTGRAMLFLTIRGTTEDYKIAYDTRSVGKKIVQDFKKEGQELKEVFQNKGKVEKKTVVLEEEEYFDFEEDTVPPQKK